MAPDTATASGGAWGKITSAAAMKVVVMGFTGLIGMLTTRLIIQHFGVQAFGQYGLLTTLPTLLPFADLGMAAVVINALAESKDPRNDPGVTATITTAVRILIGSGLVICAVAVLLTVSGLWPIVLGQGLLPGAEFVPLICMVIFGLALPLSIGPRVLVGLGRNTTQIAASSITAPFNIAGVVLMAAVLPFAGNYLAVVTYLSSAAVSALGLWLASRVIRPQIGTAVRRTPFRKRYPGVRAAHLALPMLAQMLALPVAMQTDRLLLSHLTVGDELAQYNLASQLFNIIVQTISAAGVALWPVFARARSRQELLSPVRPTLVFLGAGVAAGLALAFVSPWLVAFLGNGKLELSAPLLWGYVVFAALQAAKYPAGMYMTDARGLRFQVLPILIMVPLNLGLSWWLISLVGAGGPIIGSAVSVLLCQVIPNLLYTQRDLRARRRALEQGDEPDGISTETL
jgi:O-antigen/teichoic acid export membrane protein